jgi:hypothetical protein
VALSSGSVVVRGAGCCSLLLRDGACLREWVARRPWMAGGIWGMDGVGAAGSLG